MRAKLQIPNLYNTTRTNLLLLSSSSEEETPVCDRNPPVHKGLDPTIFFSATEEHQQAPFRKYIPPPAKCIRELTVYNRHMPYYINLILILDLSHCRSKLASRLDTLLHRQQSNKVIWLHKKNRTRESGVSSSFSPASVIKDDHEEQTFRIKSIRLPSPTFIRRFSSQVCLLASTEDQSTNTVIIFIPSSTLTDEQLNLLRDTCGQRSLEVSLFKPWFLFIFNFTGGFLAAFMVPTSVFAAERSGVRRTSSPLGNLGPGCVCEVSDLQALPQAGDDGLAATILEHVTSVREVVGPVSVIDFFC
ncbi:unnamed protein product [Dibothriocephalus latus]|uniref:Uncharacterized protein n=1 Tax=Dibothriocephalus latus TaxID=60516 RepID=A0A3P6TKQ6_DIBLA|nr:unnamed protein product [Dibothriocephalus latus]